MKYYVRCINCGANLDPCERCDCEKQKITSDLYLQKQDLDTSMVIDKYLKHGSECLGSTQTGVKIERSK